MLKNIYFNISKKKLRSCMMTHSKYTWYRRWFHYGGISFFLNFEYDDIGSVIFNFPFK